MKPNECIAKNMRTLLKEKQISLMEFSKQSGISYATLKEIVDGKDVKMQLRTILKIAQTFEVSVDWLVRESNLK